MLEKPGYSRMRGGIITDPHLEILSTIFRPVFWCIHKARCPYKQTGQAIIFLTLWDINVKTIFLVSQGKTCQSGLEKLNSSISFLINGILRQGIFFKLWKSVIFISIETNNEQERSGRRKSHAETEYVPSWCLFWLASPSLVPVCGKFAPRDTVAWRSTGSGSARQLGRPWGGIHRATSDWCTQSPGHTGFHRLVCSCNVVSRTGLQWRSALYPPDGSPWIHTKDVSS